MTEGQINLVCLTTEETVMCVKLSVADGLSLACRECYMRETPPIWNLRTTNIDHDLRMIVDSGFADNTVITFPDGNFLVNVSFKKKP